MIKSKSSWQRSKRSRSCFDVALLQRAQVEMLEHKLKQQKQSAAVRERETVSKAEYEDQAERFRDLFVSSLTLCLLSRISGLEAALSEKQLSLVKFATLMDSLREKGTRCSRVPGCFSCFHRGPRLGGRRSPSHTHGCPSDPDTGSQLGAPPVDSRDRSVSYKAGLLAHRANCESDPTGPTPSSRTLTELRELEVC
jgi:hypothetical protein